jgi:hypothetical protein
MTATAYLILLYFSADAHRNWAENPNHTCTVIPAESIADCESMRDGMLSERAGTGYSGAVRDALCVTTLPEVCLPKPEPLECPTPPLGDTTQVLGDMNGDDVVDGADYPLFLEAWQGEQSEPTP